MSFAWLLIVTNVVQPQPRVQFALIITIQIILLKFVYPVQIRNMFLHVINKQELLSIVKVAIRLMRKMKKVNVPLRIHKLMMSLSGLLSIMELLLLV